MTRKFEAAEYFDTVVMEYDGDECLDWPFAKNRSGYGRLKRDGKLHFVSRLVCQKAHGDPPSNEHQAAHSCGNGHLGCCTKRHLSWKTFQANIMDRHEHGTLKLSPDDVASIRKMAGSISGRKLARQFGVSGCLVSKIINRKVWTVIGGAI
jgi:hypothetical protein